MPKGSISLRIRSLVARLLTRVRRRPAWPPRYAVRWGSFRRLKPISSLFGTDRGQPVDRYYIERFLNERSVLIRGEVLEVSGSEYTDRFGQGVQRSDILHAVEGNPKGTIVGDLATGDGLEGRQFDCIILTQTLNVIYDLTGAINTLHRLVKPGGSVLATFPGISQVSRYDMDRWGDYWRLTSLSARKLFEESFGDKIEVVTFGNVLAAVGMLHGLAVGEISTSELNYHDPDYEVLVCIRAWK